MKCSGVACGGSNKWGYFGRGVGYCYRLRRGWQTAVLFVSVSAWNLAHTQVSVPAIWIQIQTQACYSHVTLLSPWHLKMADQWDASPRSRYSSGHKNNPRQTTTRLKTHTRTRKSHRGPLVPIKPAFQAQACDNVTRLKNEWFILF